MRLFLPWFTILAVSLVTASSVLAQPATGQAVAAESDAPFRSLVDLTYATAGDRELKLDLYLPTEATDEALPLVIWVHGGGWRFGNKDLPAESVARAIEEGFALASVSYRLSQDAIFPAQIHDVKAAVRWLRAHAEEYGLDPQRFGAWGASAGGHLVALLGTSGDVAELEGDLGNLDQSSRVQAVCDWFGPTDFPNYDQHQKDGELSANDPESLIGFLLGGAVKERMKLAKLASPISFVSEDDAPLLIFHGTADRLVPHEQSVVLRDAFQGQELPVELVTFEGVGHGGSDFGSSTTTDHIWRFFAEHLQAEE